MTGFFPSLFFLEKRVLRGQKVVEVKSKKSAKAIKAERREKLIAGARTAHEGKEVLRQVCCFFFAVFVAELDFRRD